MNSLLIKSPTQLAFGIALLIGSVQFLGCSEDITSAPPVDVPFTMFGVVNPTADTQAVIVYPVESGTLRPIGPGPFGAEVRSTDLETGDVRVWRDSVVSDGESGFSHIFWSDFQAEFGRTYEIAATRSDGSESISPVHVPQQVTIEESDEGSRRMRIAFQGGRFRLVRLELTYGVGIASRRGGECPGVRRPFRYTFPYAGTEERSADGWDLTVDLQQYYETMEEFVREDTGNHFLFITQGERLALANLTLDVTVGDETWELPSGFLDRRILSHPGTLTNVENGLGFVGGGYLRQTRLYPSAEAIDDTRFYDYLEGRPGCRAG